MTNTVSANNALTIADNTATNQLVAETFNRAVDRLFTTSKDVYTFVKTYQEETSPFLPILQSNQLHYQQSTRKLHMLRMQSMDQKSLISKVTENIERMKNKNATSFGAIHRLIATSLVYFAPSLQVAPFLVLDNNKVALIRSWIIGLSLFLAKGCGIDIDAHHINKGLDRLPGIDAPGTHDGIDVVKRLLPECRFPRGRSNSNKCVRTMSIPAFLHFVENAAIYQELLVRVPPPFVNEMHRFSEMHAALILDLHKKTYFVARKKKKRGREEDSELLSFVKNTRNYNDYLKTAQS